MSEIVIKELEYNINKYDNSLLKLEISGTNIAFPIINALRKVCINQIPIYAFHPSKIHILRNSSVFDNSYMKERLSQLPINNFVHEIKTLALKYYKDVNFTDSKMVKHKDDNNDIELYIKIKNTGVNKLLNVTTNDVRFTINDKIIDISTMYSTKSPILLIQLRQGEEFECSMKAILAVGELDSIFNAANVYYDEITENKYELMIETGGQLNEYEILSRGCEIIIEKLNIIRENVTQHQYQIIITENNSMIIEILNEDYTCGGPINYQLQSLSSVLFSGVTNPDFMQKNILIKFKVDSKYKPIDIFNEAITNTEKIFIKIMNNIKELYTDNKTLKKSKKK
jgi:DNA-directed RNA polymerase subunit L